MSPDVSHSRDRGHDVTGKQMRAERTTVAVEPFVYTSMASHFGSGYQLVVRGKGLLDAAEETGAAEQAMAALVGGAGRAGSRAYLVIGETGLVIEVRSLASDWVGRRGLYGTGLAFSIPDLLLTASKTILAVHDRRLPFLSHEKAVAIENEHGADFDDAVRLSALEVKVPGRILRDEDYAWLATHSGLVAAVIETKTLREAAFLRLSDDAGLLLRWLTVLTPPEERPACTFVTGAGGDLPFPASVRIEDPGDGTAGSTTRGAAASLEASSSPRAALFREVEALVCRIVRSGEDLDRVVSDFAAMWRSSEQPTGSFWEEITKYSRAVQVAARDADRSSASEVAEALFSLWLLERPRFRDFLAQNAAHWLVETPERLAEILTALSGVDETAHQAAIASLAEILVTSDTASDPASVLQLTQRHEPLWRLGIAWAERLIARSSVRVTAELVAAVCGLRDGGLRAMWMEALARRDVTTLLDSPSFRDVFEETAPRLSPDTLASLLQIALAGTSDGTKSWALSQRELMKFARPEQMSEGCIPSDAPTARTIIAAAGPAAPKAFEWWAACPSGASGRAEWTCYLEENAEGLSTLEVSALLDRGFAGQWFAPRRAEKLLKAYMAAASASDVDEFLQLVSRASGRRLFGPEDDLLRRLLAQAPSSLPLSRAVRQRLGKRKRRHGVRPSPLIPSIAVVIAAVGLLVVAGWFLVVQRRVPRPQSPGRETIRAAAKRDSAYGTTNQANALLDLAETIAEDPVYTVGRYMEKLTPLDVKPNVAALWPMLAGDDDGPHAVARKLRDLRMSVSNEPPGLLEAHLAVLGGLATHLATNSAVRFAWVGSNTNWTVLATCIPLAETGEDRYALVYYRPGAPPVQTSEVLRITWPSELLPQSRERSQRFIEARKAYAAMLDSADRALLKRKVPEDLGEIEALAEMAASHGETGEEGIRAFDKAKRRLEDAMKKAGRQKQEALLVKLQQARKSYERARDRADSTRLSQYAQAIVDRVDRAAAQARAQAEQGVGATEEQLTAATASYGKAEALLAQARATAQEQEEALKHELQEKLDAFRGMADALIALLQGYGGEKWVQAESLRERAERDTGTLRERLSLAQQAEKLLRQATAEAAAARQRREADEKKAREQDALAKPPPPAPPPSEASVAETPDPNPDAAATHPVPKPARAGEGPRQESIVSANKPGAGLVRYSVDSVSVDLKAPAEEAAELTLHLVLDWEGPHWPDKIRLSGALPQGAQSCVLQPAARHEDGVPAKTCCSAVTLELKGHVAGTERRVYWEPSTLEGDLSIERIVSGAVHTTPTFGEGSSLRSMTLNVRRVVPERNE